MKIGRRRTDNRPLRTRTALRYAFVGFAVGCCFPLAANVLDASLSHTALDFDGLAAAHARRPLLWIVDCVPLVLALIAGLLGRVHWRHLLVRSELESNVRHQTTALISFAGDLKRKNAELRLASHIAQASRQQYEQMFQGLPIAGFTLDSEGRIEFWNRQAERLFGLTAQEASGRRPWDVLPFEAAPEEVRETVSAVLAGAAIQNRERTVRYSDGTTLSVLTNTFPLVDSKGAVFGAVTTATDVTQIREMRDQIAQQLERIRSYATKLERSQIELVEANRTLSELATRDGLTGLKNHRAFRERLEAELAHAITRHEPMTVLMLDVDHFKQYNDTFGHPAGDELLRQLAHLLVEHCRPRDMVARYGGEEFAFILPATTQEEGRAIAERLRSTVERSTWPNRSVTVSIGVAVSSAVPASGDALVQRADRALYCAKQQGRNRVCGLEWESVCVAMDEAPFTART
ncbi:MAG: GGDEF domain-containing protein [Chthonomonadaceae bacterium]|nr:GGDEF domain-containing protein [Chthonomonadaceae bacterium]